MRKLAVALIALLALVGCANNDYYRSVDKANMGAAIGSVAPTVTTTTTNTTATTTNNSMTDSTGVLGSGTYQIDSTHAPAVVTQPAPIVVTQPAPIVVTQPAPIVVTQPAPVVVGP